MRVSKACAAKLGVKVPGRSKYRNRKTTVDGITFHSKREAKRYGELKLLEKAGKITELTLQPKFEFIVNGVKIGTYTADFWYRPAGEINAVIEDAKGFKTQQYRLRVKLMKALHGIDVKEV